MYPDPEQVTWSEALRISIDVKDGRFWLLIDPDIWIWPSRARQVAVSFLDDRRRDRYNDRYNELIDAWIKVILNTDKRDPEISLSTFKNGNTQENPLFRIATRTAFSRRLIS